MTVELRGRKLGLLLSCARIVRGLSRGWDWPRRRSNGGSTRISIAWTMPSPVGVEGLQALKSRGLKLYACAYGAHQRGLPVDDRATYVGLTVLSDLFSSTTEWSASIRPSMDSPERPSVLFLLGSDPRSSARPAEAIRVAAGVAAWKKVDVTVYLRGPAVLALGEWLDELRDEDNYSRYLPFPRGRAAPDLRRGRRP